MNYIKHLTGFFIRIATEETIYPTHISLYLALFQSWNINRFKNPITISREEMMKASRIASKATYHKCIKELQNLGFIEYKPSYNPYSGTEIIVHNLSDNYQFRNTITSSIKDKTKPFNEQVNGNVPKHVNEPYIYNNIQTFKNNKNISIDDNLENLNDEFNFLVNKEREMLLHSPTQMKNNQGKVGKKSGAKKREKSQQSFVSSSAVEKQSTVEKPSIELTKEYFKQQEYSEFEAQRFYNYYTSNGWLIGGKTKMIDWQASARNWMLNTSKFTINAPQGNQIKEQPRANNLHATVGKNYAEPL